MDMDIMETKDKYPYLTYCHNFNSYIYKGQCCKLCFEKILCHGGLNIDFQLPDGIPQLNTNKNKDRIPMGNLQTAHDRIKFDLERLFNSMVTTGVNPEKSIMEYEPNEMQQLGHCYMAAYEVIGENTGEIIESQNQTTENRIPAEDQIPF